MIEYDASRDALYQPGLRATLFQASRAPTREQLAIEAARLAYYGYESGAAELQRLKADLGLVGFADVQPFQSGALVGAQGYAAFRAEDGTALVAFRGTQPTKPADFGTNIDIVPVRRDGVAGRVHRGFHRAFAVLHAQVSGWLAAHAQATKELVLCGHSLGGAMAMVCAHHFKPAFLVTIGCPRAGDPDFVAALDGIAGRRIVNCADLVPLLPPPIFGYVHPARLTYIDKAGALHEAPAKEWVEADQAAGRCEYRDRYAWVDGAVELRDLADHAPVNYARAYF